MSDLKKLVGERIRNIRTNKNLTLHQLSQLTGQQASYLTEVELGKRNISLDSLEKIIQALDISPRDLFDFREIDPDSKEYSTRAVLEVHAQYLLEKNSEDIKLIHRIAKEIFRADDENK